jgi:hypothetical protein
MDLFEEVVLVYLTKFKGYFVSPQYSITYEEGDKFYEWSCPDFVALDFEKKSVIVAEVSVGWNISKLIDNVNNKDNTWFEKLKLQLKENKVIDDSWNFAVYGFIRNDRTDYFKEKFKGQKDVHCISIDEVMETITYGKFQNIFCSKP